MDITYSENSTYKNKNATIVMTGDKNTAIYDINTNNIFILKSDAISAIKPFSTAYITDIEAAFQKTKEYLCSFSSTLTTSSNTRGTNEPASRLTPPTPATQSSP